MKSLLTNDSFMICLQIRLQIKPYFWNVRLIKRHELDGNYVVADHIPNIFSIIIIGTGN